LCAVVDTLTAGEVARLFTQLFDGEEKMT